MEQIRKSCIPLRLKNVKNPKGSGTIIYPSPISPSSDSSESPELSATIPSGDARSAAKSIFMTANGYHGDSQYRRTPTAITVKEAITVINVRPDRRMQLQIFLGEISERLARHNLSIDLISSSQQMVSLAVSLDGPDISSTMTEALSELTEVGLVRVTKHMAIVSVVGHKMRNMVGIAGEFVKIFFAVGHKVNYD
jgi:aspartate kinase